MIEKSTFRSKTAANLFDLDRKNSQNLAQTDQKTSNQTHTEKFFPI